MKWTPHQAAVWAAVLSIFRVEDVNHAVASCIASDDPFPSLGKLVASCRRMAADRNPQPVRGEVDYSKPDKATIAAVAKALGLKI